MITCTVCSFQNLDDDSFCGSCGGFLEWTGEADVPDAAPVEEDEEDAPKRSLLSRVQTVLSLDVHAPGENEIEDDEGAPAAGGPPRPGAPPRPGGPPKPGGAPKPPARPGGPPKPPARPGSAPTPPARPGGPPKPPARPGGPPKPPARPGSAPTPPARPGGPPKPPARPGGPPKPPARPGSAPTPPARPGGPPKPPARPTSPKLDDDATPPSIPRPAVPDDIDDAAARQAAAAALVADGATAAPKPPPARPKTVAKSAPKPPSKPAPTESAVAPTAEPTVATPTAVQPVKPAKASQPRATPKQPPSHKILPGDLICGDCGEGNPPGRSFCRRCGVTLSSATVAKTPWWKRWIPKRRQRTLAAGERPWTSKDGKQKKAGGGVGAAFMRVFAKLRPIAAAALLVAGLLFGLSPDIREKVTDRAAAVRDDLFSRIRKSYAPVSPIDVSATSEVDGRPATFAIDSNTLTSWIASGDDDEPTLVVRFDEPIDLARIQLWNGSAERFKEFRRVKDIHFVFDTGQSFDLTVLDVPTPEQYEISNGGGVREVEIHIDDSYNSLGGDELGLSEIEFLVQR